MSLFLNMMGAAKGVYYGFKNGAGISKALNETQATVNVIIQPIRNKNAGYIPNNVYSDSFLIGFLYKFSLLYLLFNGLKTPYLLKRGALQVVCTAVDMKPVTLNNVMDNISRDANELRRFESGGRLAENTYELMLARDCYATLGIAEHISKTYQII